METTDLVELCDWLRSYAGPLVGTDDEHKAHKMFDAADHITALQARVEKLEGALREISDRCPPFDGDPYALPSDFNDSQEYAQNVEEMISGGTGDIARAALAEDYCGIVEVNEEDFRAEGEME